jgi:hypothetical protein
MLRERSRTALALRRACAQVSGLRDAQKYIFVPLAAEGDGIVSLLPLLAIREYAYEILRTQGPMLKAGTNGDRTMRPAGCRRRHRPEGQASRIARLTQRCRGLHGG